jgi:transcriptional regulator with XRE-family HTH domain
VNRRTATTTTRTARKTNDGEQIHKPPELDGRLAESNLHERGRASRMTGMKFSEALGEVIREQRLAKELTLREVARNGFVSMGHLSDVENGRKEGSSSFIDGVANGLGVDASELIIQAGFRMARVEVPDTPESLFVRDSKWANQYADLK